MAPVMYTHVRLACKLTCSIVCIVFTTVLHRVRVCA
jgi:hypothetical protein